MTFRKGDRIKYVGRKDGFCNADYIGKTGTVTGDDNYGRVSVEWDGDYKWPEEKRACPFPENLALLETVQTSDWSGQAYGILLALAMVSDPTRKRQLMTFLDCAPKQVVTEGARFYVNTVVEEFGI